MDWFPVGETSRFHPIYDNRRIFAVGPRSEVESHPGYKNSRKARLRGKILLPGLADSCSHLLDYAKQKIFMDLEYARSREELLDQLANQAKKARPGDWVCGFNFNETGWPDPVMPDRHDLDKLCAPNPILIQRACKHATVLNSRAMELCGLDRTYSAPAALTDSSGEPNGIIVEDLQHAAHSRMSADMFERESTLDLLRWSVSECASYGLTSISACNSRSLNTKEQMELFEILYDRCLLKVRVSLFLDSEATNPEAPAEINRRWLNWQGRKIYLDGGLGIRTAALSEPYSDSPSTLGRIKYETGELAREVVRERINGRQLMIHAVGDAAIDRALDALELYGKRRKPADGKDLPIIINHCIICRPDQIIRMKNLGAAASIQPTYVQSHREMALPRLGDRINQGWAYKWRSILESGVLVNGSSDSPTGPLNPSTRRLQPAPTRGEERSKLARRPI
jgi:predicted amidohydrolase YtcJ